MVLIGPKMHLFSKYVQTKLLLAPILIRLCGVIHLKIKVNVSHISS